MSFKRFASNSMHCLRIGLTSLALFQFSLGGPLASSAQAQSTNDGNTTTPIKHVIVIIGDNRSFDHVFATYVPKGNQKIWNLLSEGIVKTDGTPGPNFAKAHQLAAVDLGEKNGGDPFLMTPPKIDFGGDVLPAPLVGGAKDSYIPGDSLTLAEETENLDGTDRHTMAADPRQVGDGRALCVGLAGAPDFARNFRSTCRASFAASRGSRRQHRRGRGRRPLVQGFDATNASVHPGAPEICGNHIDDNCNGGGRRELPRRAAGISWPARRRRPGRGERGRHPAGQSCKPGRRHQMRLYPPTWALIPRVATQQVTIGGYELPKGAWVNIYPWVLHRDPRFFPEPERFRPRSLRSRPVETIPQHAYIPFGSGPARLHRQHLRHDGDGARPRDDRAPLPLHAARRSSARRARRADCHPPAGRADAAGRTAESGQSGGRERLTLRSGCQELRRQECFGVGVLLGLSRRPESAGSIRVPRGRTFPSASRRTSGGGCRGRHFWKGESCRRRRS